jgi:hypothetical protein
MERRITGASQAKSGVGFLVGQSKQGGCPGLGEITEAKGVKSDEGAGSDHFQMKSTTIPLSSCPADWRRSRPRHKRERSEPIHEITVYFTSAERFFS